MKKLVRKIFDKLYRRWCLESVKESWLRLKVLDILDWLS